MKIIIICLFANFVFGQNQKNFEIIGKIDSKDKWINVYSSISVKSVSDLTFSNGKKEIRLPLINGTFTLKGKSSNPDAITIVDSIASTDLIFIDLGLNKIFIDSTKKIVSSNAKLHNEYLANLKFSFKDIDSIMTQAKSREEADDMLEKNDSILAQYIKVNNQSFVAFSIISEKILIFNKTNKYIINGLENFSNKFKKSRSFIALKLKFIEINNQKIFSKKNIKLKNYALNLVDFNLHKLNNKYTLIDFWYSFCAPCIKQFSTLKTIFERFDNKGFNLIGISSDKTKDIVIWQKLVKTRNLKWSQFLDENGVFCKKNNINVFPTNFLLNEKNEIIKKNISLENLEIFLINNLK